MGLVSDREEPLEWFLTFGISVDINLSAYSFSVKHDFTRLLSIMAVRISDGSCLAVLLVSSYHYYNYTLHCCLRFTSYFKFNCICNANLFVRMMITIDVILDTTVLLQILRVAGQHRRSSTEARYYILSSSQCEVYLKYKFCDTILCAALICYMLYIQS